MSTELIINASLPETRIALTENGEIQELLIERASGKGIVGNIYKGRVTRVLPGMQAAFVDIGLEKAAFLYVDDVFVHSEIWEEEEGPAEPSEEVSGGEKPAEVIVSSQDLTSTQNLSEHEQTPASLPPILPPLHTPSMAESEADAASHLAADDDEESEEEPGLEPQLGDEEDDDDDDADESDDSHEQDEGDEEVEDDEDDDCPGDDHGPVGMGPPPESGDGGSGGDEESPPSGTVSPKSEEMGGDETGGSSEHHSSEVSGTESSSSETQGESSEEGGDRTEAGRKRYRRGRRGGRNRKRERGDGRSGAERPVAAGVVPAGVVVAGDAPAEGLPNRMRDQLSDSSDDASDRSAMVEGITTAEGGSARPENVLNIGGQARQTEQEPGPARRPEFKESRSKDRRIRPKTSSRPPRGQANIQDLLHEGQEVLVQVAKDPISTKGARLTCHISLPGRHLVCMPTIDHVGVSRRIERDDERRRLREYVERNRPRNLGFIVRTASGKSQSEKRIKQDIDYLTRLWGEIREKAANVTAPAMVYEDLNSVLRAIRDWVTEEIDKIIVDSRYHYNEMLRFVSHFMPSLRQKVELYHGDVPIFDAYNITTELSRSLERKVWLKSGGYLVVDQAEALVAIDVNTGRYVGKKNLEDTILKTNLEAVQEIAYQLRLRNCGGIIILDLIDMEKEENKQRVYRALEEALKKDRARPTILKISELGLVEMTRKRTRDTIIRTLCESCTHCEGKGFIKSKQTVAYEVMREMEREGIERDVSKILVQAHPDVIDILAIDERESLDQLERRYRKTIFLQSVGDFHPEQFEVVGEKKDRAERARDQLESRTQEPRRESQGQLPQVGEREGGARNRPGGGRDRNDRNRSSRDRGTSTGSNSGGDRTRGGRDRTPVQTQPRAIHPRAPRVDQTDLGADSQPQIGGEALEHSQVPEHENVIQSSRAIIKVGESQPPRIAVPTITPAAHVQPSQSGHQDDFFDEEDRLAFLRAQAAQDAALASLQANSAAAPNRTPRAPGFGMRGGEGPSNRPGGGDRGNAPGGRGAGRGKRRGRTGRGRDAAPPPAPIVGGQPPRVVARPDRGPIPVGAGGPTREDGVQPGNIVDPIRSGESREPANNTGTNAATEKGGTTNDIPSQGGGGDHSNPPT